MKLWIARDQDEDLNLYIEEPRLPNLPGRQCWVGTHLAMLDNYLFPEVTFNMGTIICKKRNTQEITFTSEGYYMLPVFDDCECQLFPSKDQRDWSKFQRPFKDGDKITDKNGLIYRITEITDKGYKLHDSKTTFITFEEANLYFVKVADIFDINTLKPFDKVLVRDYNDENWVINLYGNNNKADNTFRCIGNCDVGWKQCVPYVGNEHLLGTIDDCNEFYKNW